MSSPRIEDKINTNQYQLLNNVYTWIFRFKFLKRTSFLPLVTASKTCSAEEERYNKRVRVLRGLNNKR